MKAEEIKNLPTYSNANNKEGSYACRNRDSIENKWYYFTKYYSDSSKFEIDVEDLDNVWGFGFVVKAYFSSSQDLHKERSKSNSRVGDTAFYATLDGVECYIPIRWEYVVGKKGKEFLDKNKN